MLLYRVVRVDRYESGTCGMNEFTWDQVWKWDLRNEVYREFLSLCGHPAWLSCVIWVVMWGMWCICVRGGGGGGSVSLGEVS